MADAFVGRAVELDLLDKRLRRVASSAAGIAVALRGCRQVGKSRLAQEFCDRSGRPYLYYAATKGMSAREAIGEFCRALAESSLPSQPESVPAATSWPDAFRVLSAALPDQPSVVVLDEIPWLAEQDGSFDGVLQTAWDRQLRTRPVLLLMLGSDVHMMERLTAYDRPFFGRADAMVLDPLNVADTAAATGLSGADAIDARLISGGLPGILRIWPPGTPTRTFVENECADPASPLFGVSESALAAEFPTPDQSRRVLEAIGAGQRTQANIAVAAGGAEPVASGSLSPLLRRLVEDKRVVAVDEPLSARPGKPALYRVADSSLRFYLAIGRSAHDLAQRGRAAAAVEVVRRRWSPWRGRAVEPLIRESLELAGSAGGLPWSDAEVVGGWWNRRFDPKIDIVGGDRRPVARQVRFAGSIKWLSRPFNAGDAAELRQGAGAVPGFTPGSSGLIAVSLSGAERGLRGVDVLWGPDDVVAAWPKAA